MKWVGLLYHLNRLLGLPPKLSKSAIYSQIQKTLLESRESSGKTIFLIIDEAHLLQTGPLEKLRLLTNFKMDSYDPFILVLSSQSDLKQYRKRILEADLKNFFGSLDHGWLLRFVEHRVGDPRIISLIKHWLKAGVLEEGEFHSVEAETPQGGSISVLSNIYLHYVLDLWFEKVIKPQLKGEAYCGAAGKPGD